MIPKLPSDNFPGIELIRPMYLVKEKDIKAQVKFHDLKFLNCASRFTEKVANHEEVSKRYEMKQLVENFREIQPTIGYNIFKAMDNVNMDCILGYKKIVNSIVFQRNMIQRNKFCLWGSQDE